MPALPGMPMTLEELAYLSQIVGVVVSRFP
jgi:hypothetical protein